MLEPCWIEERVVLAMHQWHLAAHGGMPGIRDRGLLESALARPRNLYVYETEACSISSLTAAYVYGIVRNHPFLDGNKRTRYTVGRVFLLRNGFDWYGAQDEKVALMWRLANGALSEYELGSVLHASLLPRA